jgi:hypothetical protein
MPTWALACPRPSNDHDCPSVTVVGRSLSHEDRTPRLRAPGSRASSSPNYRRVPGRDELGSSPAVYAVVHASGCAAALLYFLLYGVDTLT